MNKVVLTTLHSPMAQPRSAQHSLPIVQPNLEAVETLYKTQLEPVLGIQEYYLVDIFCQSLDSIADSCQKTYKPSSPQSERLTLRVTKFKFLGSQGERAFGKPEAIEEQESIWEVLNRLDKVLAGSESDTNGSDGRWIFDLRLVTSRIN